MSPDLNEVESAAQDAKGKVKEKVGWATGDREVEAEGRVEREKAESLDEAEDEVRRANQEID
jgi:uncharacterized protein YjbJ (UPF0337 family)